MKKIYSFEIGFAYTFPWFVSIQHRTEAVDLTEKENKNGQNETKDKSKINLNEAMEADLLSIQGIRLDIAKRIVHHRETSGKFKSIEEIRDIQGIGEKTFEKLQSHLTL